MTDGNCMEVFGKIHMSLPWQILQWDFPWKIHRWIPLGIPLSHWDPLGSLNPGVMGTRDSSGQILVAKRRNRQGYC